MKRIATLITLLTFALLSTVAHGVEVGTTLAYGPVTVTKSFSGKNYLTHVYIFDCLSHTDGALSGGQSKAINGKIAQVEFFPDSGDTAPTALFDVTAPASGSLTSESMTGSDVTTTYSITDAFLGIGANLSESVSTARTPMNTDGFLKFMNGESLSISATGVGSANGFTIIVTVIP